MSEAKEYVESTVNLLRSKVDEVSEKMKTVESGSSEYDMWVQVKWDLIKAIVAMDYTLGLIDDGKWSAEG